MKNNNKKVKFDFFQLMESGMLKDIRRLLEEIYKLNPEERILTINNDKVKLDKLSKEYLFSNNEPDVYYFHVTKLRTEGMGYTKDVSDGIKELDLNSDEYLAEDINCLFDSDKCVLMIQRNINSISVSGLIGYLNEMHNFIQGSDGYDIRPSIVMNKQALNDVKKLDNYRKLVFRIASDKISPLSKMGSRFGNAISDIFSQYGGNYITIDINVGKSRKDNLNETSVKDLINDYQSNEEAFNKFEIRGNNDFSGVETFDLVQKKFSACRNYELIVDKNNKKHRLDERMVRDDIVSVYKSGLKDSVDRNI